MAHVQDVARFILDKLAPGRSGDRVTAWKLQKLVYYAQAWSLVWDDAPLFPEEIQAWADGPVCPALYELHRGRYALCADDIDGDPSVLTLEEIGTIEVVLEHYGSKSGRYLSDLTHMERPWKEARGDLPAGTRSNAVIAYEDMVEYYGGL